MALAALLANVLAPYDPLDIDYGAMLQAPGLEPLARHRRLRPRRAVAASLRLADGAAGGLLRRPSSARRSGAMIGVSVRLLRRPRAIS